MSQIRSVLTFVLLLVPICQAKTGSLRATNQDKGILPNWIIGLGAVVGFLFIIFVILIVKRLFFKSDRYVYSKQRTSEPDCSPNIYLFEGPTLQKDEEDEVKSEREVAVYENKALDVEAADESKTTNL